MPEIIVPITEAHLEQLRKYAESLEVPVEELASAELERVSPVQVQ